MLTDYEAFGLIDDDIEVPARTVLEAVDQVFAWTSSEPELVPTVFLPGLLNDAALWRPQIDALADTVAPFVADLTLDDTIEAMARRVLTSAPPRFALVALSMGGYVALEIMRQAPERVTRLALLDTSARADTPERAAERRVKLDSLSRGKFVGVPRNLLASLVHESKLDGPVAEELRAMAIRVGGAAFIRQQRAILRRIDSRPWLSEIRIPTLIAVGDADQITPLRDALELSELIPGARFHVFSGCGHLPALELPDETTSLLKTWLGGTAI